jgi:hypothetical protein
MMVGFEAIASAGGIVEIANNLLGAVCYNYRLPGVCEMLIYYNAKSCLCKQYITMPVHLTLYRNRFKN